MADLYFGILIVMLLSAGMLWLGLVVGRRAGRRRASLLLMIALLLLLAYQKFAADKLWMAKILPFSNLVIVGNFFPPLVALMAGLGWRLMPGGAVRRSVLLGPLVALPWVWIGHLVFGKPPELLNRWAGQVCLQSSDASCSAAAAATLLHAYRIESTEQEMADACLTRPNGQWIGGGTPMQGLYRGLKLKAAALKRKPAPFTGSLEDLRKNLREPVILTVELLVGDPHTGQYEQMHWDPGMRHTIVLFRFLQDGRAFVGDPDEGPETWSYEDLQVLWHGEGLRLESK